MENPQILNDYLKYLISVKAYSSETIKIYNIHLLSFFNYIKEYNNIKRDVKDFNKFILMQVKEKDIISYLVYCNYAKNNAPNTRELKLTAIRGFYNWLLRTFKNDYFVNPADDLGKIKKNVILPKYLNLEQAKQIQNIFNKKNSIFPEKNNAILSLFLSSGLRMSELINIKFNDIDFNNNSIQIIGKGNKQRTVYFSNYCKKQIQKYISTRKDDITYLFISSRNKKFSRREIDYIVKKAYSLIKVDDRHYSTHTLRHTAATLMYMYVKNDTLLLKQFLGHSSIESTQIYTHVYNEAVKEAVEKNPLSNFTVKKR